MSDIKYYKLIHIAKIIKGLQFNSQYKNQNEDELENVKVLSCSDVKKLIEKNNTDDIEFSKQDLSRKYKNCYIQQGDIVVPVFPKKEKLEILYIENEPKEKCVYNESNLVIRIKETGISSRYISVILNSETVKNNILARCKGTSRQLRITMSDLSDIYIPIIAMEQQKAIVKEYVELKSKMIKFQNKIGNMFKRSDEIC